MFIYNPEDVRLRPNITNSTICAEYIVNFTCSADANSAVNRYTLFKNDSVVNTSTLEVWSITMNTAEQFVHGCEEALPGLILTSDMSQITTVTTKQRISYKEQWFG